MTIVQDDPPVLQGEDTETISLEVTSALTAHVVSCVLDQTILSAKASSQNASTFEFKLGKAKCNPSELRIGFVYSGTKGSYTVVTRGDKGGDTHTRTYRQKFQVPADGKEYQFPIE